MTYQHAYILAHDVGTTGSKTCLYRIGESIEPVAARLAEYPLTMTGDGGAEQSADHWWDAICRSTRRVIDQSRIAPEAVAGMAFCCQMQGSVLVDRSGRALRNPMIYMDGRAVAQHRRHLCHGLFRIGGWNGFKVLRSLMVTGGLAATPKDPLWKYHWVRDNEPDIFGQVYRWLDVKDYLVHRCTGRFAMTTDSAHLTFLYDTRKGRQGWHDGLCRLFKVDMGHLPEVVDAATVVGGLTDDAARQMGLAAGTPVVGGGGDVTLTAIGAGCTGVNDTHIYVGTSGWVAANVEKRMVDIGNFIAAICGAMHGRYNYIAEQETSGACLQWVRDHLALDEIGVYLKEKSNGADREAADRHLYELLNRTVAETPPGSGGVIFTPWLHGNRAPREDADARGMFFNISLSTGKRMLVRAVLEGVAFHKRWMLEAVEKKIPLQESIRFVGGGAKSAVWCQIMADVTGRRIETIDHPQDAGAAGAALVCAVGLGLLSSYDHVKRMIPVRRVFLPDAAFRETLDRQYRVFTTLYKNNRKSFAALNRN
jgi:xylulokinase